MVKYSKEPDNLTKSCKGRGSDLRVHFKATLAPPLKRKMFKGLCVCYSVVTVTFFSVAVSDYWAFGNDASGIILTNFIDTKKSLLPKRFLLMTYCLTLLQLSAVAVVYLQPTNEVLEKALSDPKGDQFSVRNVLPRLISRTLSVDIAITIATMLPFFGDINAFLGAFEFIPLDFVLPIIFFNLIFKSPKRAPKFWLNTMIAVVFSILGVITAVVAVRQIILDAKTYKLFTNV